MGPNHGEREDPAREKESLEAEGRARASALVRRLLDALPRLSGALLVLLGAVVLVGGWWLEIRPLLSLGADLEIMQANTAMGFILLGVGLLAAGPRPAESRGSRWALVLGAGVGLWGLLSLDGELLGWSLSIDSLLIEDRYTDPQADPGRMSVATALAFVLSGVGLWAASWSAKSAVVKRWVRWSSRASIVCVGAISLLAVSGYLYDVGALYRVGIYASVAVHTAAGFVVAFLGLSALGWEESPVAMFAHETTDGMLLRRLLPPAFLVPFVLGILFMAMERADIVPYPIAQALLALSCGGLLVALIWRTGVVVENLDLARKRAKRELVEQREWLDITLSSIGDAVIATDVDTRVNFINTVAQQLTGLSEEEACGRPVDEIISLVTEEGQQATHIPIHRALFHEKIVGFPVRTALLTREGESLPIEDSSAPIVAEDGEVVGAVWVFRDVREARLEEQRREEYLSMLAHELRNPLAPVLTGAEMLGKMETTPLQDDMLAIIKRQVRHLARLVDDLLEVTRIRRGQIAFRRAWHSLSEIVVGAVDVARPVAEQRGHSLTLKVDPAAAQLEVEADRERLHQVLSNLLFNAIKFTPDEGHIEVRVGRDEEGAVIRVIDDGRGISAADLGSVFEPFVQSQPSFDRAEGGLGLGLAVVREIVEGHGGRVSAHSDGIGMGAEFTVVLPHVRDRQIEAPIAQPTPEGRRRILLVEDNPDVASTMARMLTLAGHEVDVAADGRTGLQRFADFQPEVVLLDIGLPGIDGHEVARRLREQSGGEALTIIALTGYGRAGANGEPEDPNFDHAFVKPVDLERLRAAIGTAVSDESRP